MISVFSHYLLNLCHSEIKDTISARAQHISLCQVLTKSPPPLFSIGPLVQFVLTFLLPSGPLLDLSPEDPDLTLVFCLNHPIYPVSPLKVMKTYREIKAGTLTNSSGMYFTSDLPLFHTSLSYP